MGMITKEEIENIIYNKLEYDIHDLALDLRTSLERAEDLKTELLLAQSYADKLVRQSKWDILPKDIENLRDANGKFAEENFELKQYILNLFKDFDFDNPVRTYHALMEFYTKYNLKDL